MTMIVPLAVVDDVPVGNAGHPVAVGSMVGAGPPAPPPPSAPVPVEDEQPPRARIAAAGIIQIERVAWARMRRSTPQGRKAESAASVLVPAARPVIGWAGEAGQLREITELRLPWAVGVHQTFDTAAGGDVADEAVAAVVFAGTTLGRPAARIRGPRRGPGVNRLGRRRLASVRAVERDDAPASDQHQRESRAAGPTYLSSGRHPRPRT